MIAGVDEPPVGIGFAELSMEGAECQEEPGHGSKHKLKEYSVPEGSIAFWHWRLARRHCAGSSRGKLRVMSSYLAVAVGSAIGGMLRFALAGWLMRAAGGGRQFSLGHVGGECRRMRADRDAGGGLSAGAKRLSLEAFLVTGGLWRLHYVFGVWAGNLWAVAGGNGRPGLDLCRRVAGFVPPGGVVRHQLR